MRLRIDYRKLKAVAINRTPNSPHQEHIRLAKQLQVFLHAELNNGLASSGSSSWQPRKESVKYIFRSISVQCIAVWTRNRTCNVNTTDGYRIHGQVVHGVPRLSRRHNCIWSQLHRDAGSPRHGTWTSQTSQLKDNTKRVRVQKDASHLCEPCNQRQQNQHWPLKS